MLKFISANSVMYQVVHTSYFMFRRALLAAIQIGDLGIIIIINRHYLIILFEMIGLINAKLVIF